MGGEIDSDTLICRPAQGRRAAGHRGAWGLLASVGFDPDDILGRMKNAPASKKPPGGREVPSPAEITGPPRQVHYPPPPFQLCLCLFGLTDLVSPDSFQLER